MNTVLCAEKAALHGENHKHTQRGDTERERNREGDSVSVSDQRSNLYLISCGVLLYFLFRFHEIPFHPFSNLPFLLELAWFLAAPLLPTKKAKQNLQNNSIACVFDKKRQ